MPKMRIFCKKAIKIAAASGTPPRTPVGLRRLAAEPQTPILLLPLTATTLSRMFLAFKAFTIEKGVKVTTTNVLFLFLPRICA